MLPKKGRSFPRHGRQKLDNPRYAAEIGQALRNELGGSHQSVKAIMNWTCAGERTIKNWLSGINGPNGAHLIEVIRHSDAVCALVLQLAGRDVVFATIRVADLRNRLAAALAELDRIQRK
jgi:hypothetical protein